MSMREINKLKVDKSFFEVIDIQAENDKSHDLQYWLSKSPQERIEGIETMRQAMYPYDPISARLPRFLEISQQS